MGSQVHDMVVWLSCNPGDCGSPSVGQSHIIGPNLKESMYLTAVFQQNSVNYVIERYLKLFTLTRLTRTLAKLVQALTTLKIMNGCHVHVISYRRVFASFRTSAFKMETNVVSPSPLPSAKFPTCSL